MNKRKYGKGGTTKVVPRKIKLVNGGYFDPMQYGLGGMIGTGLGAIGGSFVGNPMAGASIGGAIGSQFDNPDDPNFVPETVTAGHGSLGTYAYGGGYKPYAHGGGVKKYSRGGFASKMGKRGHAITGRSHAEGGVMMSPEVEVEGGETMDELQGEGYVFSDRLKVPGSNETFADRHKKLVSMGADNRAIDNLAEMQERVSGRQDRQLGNETGQPVEAEPFAYGGYSKKFQSGGRTGNHRSGVNVRRVRGTVQPRSIRSTVTSKPVRGTVTSKPVRGTVTSQPVRSNVQSSPVRGRAASRLVRSNIRSAPVEGGSATRRRDNRSNFRKKYYTGGTLPETTVNADRETPKYKTVGTYGLDMSAPNMSTENIPRADNPGIPMPDGKIGRDFNWGTALQLAPDVINFATAAFGKDKTEPATQVGRARVDNTPINYNINPELRSSAKAYRGVLSNPGTSSQERLAALSMRGQRDSAAHATKANVETQMREQRAGRQAGLDANRHAQQASLDEQARQDRMQSAAQLGITGNMSRAALANISSKLLQMKRDNALTERDKETIEALRLYYGDDPSLQGLFED